MSHTSRDEDVPTLPSPDAVAPWGARKLPLTGRWSEDILGAPFQALTLPLERDEEGKVVATLVRLKPTEKKRLWRRKKRFALLYVHGRNDYFFQTEAAKRFDEMGAAFYALDLRKFGRSLRPWQTIGFTDDLTVYDEELNMAVETIEQEHPGLPIVAFAHSTGGLIVALWAWRTHQNLKAIIFNSAWLELQSMTAIRPTLERVMRGLAGVNPRATVIAESKVDTYHRSLSKGWGTSGFEIPHSVAQKPDDPSMVGWDLFPEWKKPFSYPVPAAWLNAVLVGHRLIETEVVLDCPVLSLASTKAGSEDDWVSDVFNSDIVLDPDLVSARAATISRNVTIARLPGKHDLLLSDPPVREKLYELVENWLDYAFTLTPEDD